MPETRCTIVIADDPDTETVSIRALGDAFMPAPIERPVSQFGEAWREFGEKMAAFHVRDRKDRGPWSS